MRFGRFSLDEALGAAATVAVEVGNDATHGTRVTLRVSGEKPGSAEDNDARIAATMKAYSHYYVIERAA